MPRRGDLVPGTGRQPQPGASTVVLARQSEVRGGGPPSSQMGGTRRAQDVSLQAGASPTGGRRTTLSRGVL
eukprot:8030552-Pyramimonas_sp.AAC.1